MTVKRKCSGKTWSDIGHNRIYQCSRNATIQRDGKWYCWQHDPEYIAKKATERHAAWEAEGDREAAKYAHIARNARLGALVTPELAALLERLAWLANNYAAENDGEAACALTARIREALVLEANDEG